MKCHHSSLLVILLPPARQKPNEDHVVQDFTNALLKYVAILFYFKVMLLIVPKQSKYIKKIDLCCTTVMK